MILIEFTTPKKFNPFSWAIKAIERREFSHVIVRWYNRDLDREIVFQSSVRGVTFMGAQAFWKKNKKVKTYVVNLPTMEIIKFKQWCIDVADKKYDYGAIIKSAINKFVALLGLPMIKFKSNGPSSMFCSELLARAFKDKFADLIKGKELDFITPSDLDKMLDDISKIPYSEVRKTN